MRILKTVIAITVVMVASLPASAQFRFGVKAGVDFNTVTSSVIDIENNNRTGVTAGVTAEYNLPLTGLSLDLSVMYANRNTACGTTSLGNVPEEDDLFYICDVTTAKQDYIEVPLNVKYKFDVPAVKPFIAVGPSVAFKVSKDNPTYGYFAKKTDLALNFGAGVEVFNHLQVGATYSLGMLDTVEVQFKPAWGDVKAMNRGFKITATYLF